MSPLGKRSGHWGPELGGALRTVTDTARVHPGLSELIMDAVHLNDIQAISIS